MSRDTFHGRMFVFSSFFFFFFFFLLFFVDRPTNDHVLCGDLFLGKFKRKRNEEAYCSVPVVEAAEFGIRRRRRKTVYRNRGFVCSLEIPPAVPASAKRDLWTEQRRRWSVGKKRKMAREIRSCAGWKWPGQTRIRWSTNWSKQRTWSRRISRAPRVRYTLCSISYSTPFFSRLIGKYKWSRWNAI